MTNTPKEADFSLKQEGFISIDDHEKAKAASSAAAAASSSAQWLRLKDPRIVRVSRAFGGKDRHSKVCTIRGLRDRRVRLSVPTAIHLYDLQDRLGLNQPSKVVDWLLNAAKDEIDELPPLPIPPGNFTLGYPSLATTSISNEVSRFQNRATVRPIARDSHLINYDEEDHNKEESGNNCVVGAAQYVLPNNLLIPSSSSSRPNHHPSFLGLLNTMPIGNYQWEPSSSSSSSSASYDVVAHHHQLGNHEPFGASINVLPFPSTLSLSTGNNSSSSSASQILVCSHHQGAATTTTQSYFPSSSSSSHVASAMEMDQRQINNFHQMLMMSSSASAASSHHQNLLTPKLFHSSNSQSHKGHHFPSE